MEIGYVLQTESNHAHRDCIIAMGMVYNISAADFFLPLIYYMTCLRFLVQSGLKTFDFLQ